MYLRKIPLLEMFQRKEAAAKLLKKAATRGATPSSSSSRQVQRVLLSSEPFYGSPRPRPSSASSVSSGDDYHCSSSTTRIQLAISNAMTAWQDPTRADAVAAVGELTGRFALQRLLTTMQADPVGRLILQERPIVSKSTIPYEKLLKSSSSATVASLSADDDITFGQAYGAFLHRHGFDPDERDPVKYLHDNNNNNNNNNEDLAYVMLRYRQCHDFWHALTGLPPTVLGEVALKWLELLQTGLPLAALSGTAGALRLLPNDDNQLLVLCHSLVPWAVRQGQVMKFGALLNVYYEHEWDTPLVELLARLQLQPAPRIVDDGL